MNFNLSLALFVLFGYLGVIVPGLCSAPEVATSITLWIIGLVLV